MYKEGFKVYVLKDMEFIRHIAPAALEGENKYPGPAHMLKVHTAHSDIQMRMLGSVGPQNHLRRVSKVSRFQEKRERFRIAFLICC